jgi:hypothetical protein
MRTAYALDVTQRTHERLALRIVVEQRDHRLGVAGSPR